jgi:hypothetical protein
MNATAYSKYRNCFSSKVRSIGRYVTLISGIWSSFKLGGAARARHVYSWRDIRWQHRYRNITSVSPQGRVLLDYTKFHDVVAEE